MSHYSLDELKKKKQSLKKLLPPHTMMGVGDQELFVYLDKNDQTTIVPSTFEGVKVVIKEKPADIIAGKCF